MAKKQKKQLKFIINDDFIVDRDVVCCPKCGFEYNHPGKITQIPGNDNYEAGWSGRGDLITVYMECENGHRWELCLGFHKGNVMIFGR